MFHAVTRTCERSGYPECAEVRSAQGTLDLPDNLHTHEN